MAALADGSVLICDTYNNCIRSLSADLRTVTTVTGSAWPAGHKDGPLCQAQFDRPTGILRLRDNRMLVCQFDCTIRILSPDLKEVYTLCGTPYDDGYRCGVHFPLVDGKAADAVFRYPHGYMTLLRDGRVTVSCDRVIRVLHGL